MAILYINNSSDSSSHFDFRTDSWEIKILTNLSVYRKNVIYFFRRWTGILGLFVLASILLIPFFILYSFLYVSLRNLSRDIIKNKNNIISDIEKKNIKYEDLMELEETINKLIKRISDMRLKIWSLELPANQYIDIIISHLKDIKSISISRYSFLKDEIFDNEDDFKAYNESLSVFNDIWDFNTPESSKKIVFDLKNKSLK